MKVAGRTSISREDRRRRLVALQRLGERVAREAAELLAEEGVDEESAPAPPPKVTEMDRQRARAALRRIGVSG